MGAAWLPPEGSELFTAVALVLWFLEGEAALRRPGTVVLHDALLQHRGHILMGAGHSIAVGVIICKSIVSGFLSSVLRRTPGEYFGAVRVPVFSK